MLDRFKQLLGISEASEEDNAEQKPKNEKEEADADEVAGKTYEDIIAELVQQSVEEAKKEEEKYRELTQKMSEASVEPEAKPQEETKLELDENATVNDLLNVVFKEVDRKIREALANIPQTGLVESIVRENPSLKSVQDDAMKIAERLPTELRKRETVEMLMWALKGMKAEAEKRSVLTEVMESIVGERRRESNFVPLPYSSAEIEGLANKLKLDPNSLKKRLVKEFAKGGRVSYEED
jgi:hypothetical protein